MAKPGLLIDLTNQRFGRWLVLSRGPNNGTVTRWHCICECGKEKLVSGQCIREGTSKSCGCFQAQSASKRNLKHGFSQTPEHKTWKTIQYRCLNPANKSFKDYGGRGIKVCDRWLDSFNNFLEDMGLRPTGRSIERIDVNGNYEPTNCRWATMAEQGVNKRNNHFIEAFGEKKTITEWIRILKIGRFSVRNNLAKGRSLEEIAARRGRVYGGGV